MSILCLKEIFQISNNKTKHCFSSFSHKIGQHIGSHCHTVYTTRHCKDKQKNENTKKKSYLFFSQDDSDIRYQF